MAQKEQSPLTNPPTHEQRPRVGFGVPAMGPAWLPPEQYAETVLKATAFACLFFTDEHDNPLQLRAVYSQTHPWQFVGGTMDPGERPWETAVRECQEETGIAFRGQARLLASIFGQPGAEWPYATIGFVFEGGRLTGDEIKSSPWIPPNTTKPASCPCRSGDRSCHNETSPDWTRWWRPVGQVQRHTSNPGTGKTDDDHPDVRPSRGRDSG